MGLSSDNARPLAAATPTSKAPARPGPLVTATASTSAGLIPAVSQARRIVGTIASRCARLATSGTTPPNRACSSTLDAIASASSVCPRTIPTPVSSHDVSIPRIRGSLIDPPPHDHRILAVTVVPTPPADLLEPETRVQTPRRFIAQGNFQ